MIAVSYNYKVQLWQYVNFYFIKFVVQVFGGESAVWSGWHSNVWSIPVCTRDFFHFHIECISFGSTAD